MTIDEIYFDEDGIAYRLDTHGNQVLVESLGNCRRPIRRKYSWLP